MTPKGNVWVKLVARDEMQLHVPQDYATATEVQEIMGVNKMIVSAQSNKPIIGIIQDCLVGSYLLTHPNERLPKNQFMNCVWSAGEGYAENIADLFKRAREFYSPEDLYTGRVLFSVLFPRDFQYRCKNGGSAAEPEVIIKNGILTSGIINGKVIGRSYGSIIHRLYKEYSPDRAAEFISALQFLVNKYLVYHGFSVGIADFIISDENKEAVRESIQKAYIEVRTIQESNDPALLKEFKLNNALNNRGQNLVINGLCPGNRLETMINCGSKGNRMNVIQITGHLGQNNVEGWRIIPEIDDGQRTLPCFERGQDMEHPTARGFIEHSFMDGLSPVEFFFHAKAGREGVINTAVRTRETGYAERKLVKRMEDLVVEQDLTVRNSVGNIIQFTYGGDNLDATWMVDTDGAGFIDLDTVVERLNTELPERPAMQEIHDLFA